MQIININIGVVLQIILALGLINVWVLRFHKPTAYRGKGAKTMAQEFQAYGLPRWFMYLVGFAKLSIAGLLLLGLVYPAVVPAALYVLGFLMLGALAMHAKVRDSFVKFVPALLMLAMVVANLWFVSAV